MGLPLRQAAKIGAYVMKKHLSGGKYPLVLMLEPLFRCNQTSTNCSGAEAPAVRPMDSLPVSHSGSIAEASAIR